MARRNTARPVALGGVMAALAVVIMSMGTLIPVATFLCPTVCLLLLKLVLGLCGRRIAWAWYGAVALLSLLLAPDKEAVAVFAFLGYYPIVKPWFDGRKLRFLWKTVYFNATVLLLYSLLLHVFGMAQLAAEFSEMGTAMTVVTLLLGNVVFLMLDMLLEKRFRRRNG